jgi:gamma-glutamyltranspeptidase / glutathione hydrolase
MSETRSMGTARAGEPPRRRAQLIAPSEGHVEFGTSHISIIDNDGNAVAMTTTIEDGFGARIMTRGGFLLNNQLTDFNFAPSVNGVPVANRVEPGKRPRSSMAPTLVFDAFGRLYAVVGSPGGSQIIGYVAKTIIGLTDWRLDPQAAVDLPNFGSRNGTTEVERGTEAEGWTAALQARGHEVRAIDMTSGIQAIVVSPIGYLGGADSRREGVAVGD